MSKSSLVSYTRFSPNYTAGRVNYTRITPHCVVGQLTVESIGSIFAPRSRSASSTYGIGKDGRVGQYVDEKNRSWCTSSAANDTRAITIECACDLTAPYAFNDKVYTTLVNLCVDICRRHGKTKLLWLGSKSKALNYTPKSNEMILTAHRWFSNTACVPVDSEVLTKNGWVKLKDINIGDEIACADLENLRITFEEVYDKVPEREQDTYTNNGFTATKDHRCVYHTHTQSEWRIDYYKNLLRNGTQVYIPLAGYSDPEGMKIIDDELRLMIAVQADGHYMKEKRREGFVYTGLEFHLKKDRKIERIKELLVSCNLEYTETHKSDGSVSLRVWGKDIVDECESFLNDKCFTWKWLEMSDDQAQIFLNEILFWDGVVDGNRYDSKQKINLDVVSAIAATHGVGSNIVGSGITFRNNPYITLGMNEESTRRNCKRNKTPKTKVSCVSVKTGIFLVRQNGKTFITGNCPGDWLYGREGDLANRVNAILDRGSVAPSTSQQEIVVEDKIDTDGIVGYKTIAKWQKIMGTPIDGEISGQLRSLKRYHLAFTKAGIWYSSGGSMLIEAAQKQLGFTGDDADGQLGPVTISAIQKRFGFTGDDVDGLFGKKTAKALQERLNSGKF